MRWDLRAARDGWAIESGQYQRNTGQVPSWWADKPPEVRGDEFYLRAFWELASCRSFGQVFGPIPWNRVIQYSDRKRLTPEASSIFELVIRQLDEAYLRDLRDNQRKHSEASHREANRSKQR